MNKYLFIIGFAGMALLSACSTSDDLTAEEPYVTPPVEETKENSLIVEARQDSDIPITLGVGESRGMTRAPINPVDGSGQYRAFDTEVGRFLGVFCLATGPQSYVSNIPNSIKSNKWKKDDDTGLLVRLCNVAAKVESGTVTFVDPANSSNIKHYYYPQGNWMRYNFYAYYPRQETSDELLSIDESAVVETKYVIDGSQDVIWGKAYYEEAPKVTTTNDAEPYCAKYFREKKDSLAHAADPTPGKIVEVYPNLKFEHKFVQFQFFVQANSADDLTAMNNMGGMAITNMYIDNAINIVKLTVAHKTLDSENGKLKKGKSSDFRGPLSIRYVNPSDKTDFRNVKRFDVDNDGALDTPFTIAASGIDVDTATPVGYILLPPPTTSDETEKYVLCLNYSVNGVAQPELMQVELEGDFVAGQVYKILVSVKSPQEINARAVVRQWDDANPSNYTQAYEL